MADRLPAFQRLPPSVQNKLRSLWEQRLCTANDFDDRVLGLLGSLTSADAVSCLDKLESALHVPDSVRNPSAYLAGVVKRVTGSMRGGTGGGSRFGPPADGGVGSGLPHHHNSHAAGAPPPAAAPPQLAPLAQQVLDTMYAQGRLRPGDLDARSLAPVAAMQPEMQAFVMRSFADRNLSGIRNMAAFFATHVTQAERDVREGRVRLPPPGSMPPPPSMAGNGSGMPLLAGMHPPGPGMAAGAGPQRMAAPTGLVPLPRLSPEQGISPGLPPPPQQQAPFDQMSGAYDPAAVQPRQQPPPGGPQQGQFVPPQQQQQQPGALPMVDLQQLNGLLQSLAQHPLPQTQQQPQQQQQQALPPQQQQQMGGQGAGFMAAPAAVAPVSPRPAPPKHYGLEQLEWGVRVDEFHGLSPFAKYVHPGAALKLQQLWDSGNKLVSLLDDVSWEALAGLDAQHSIAVVGEVAEATRAAPDDIGAANSMFVAAAARHPKRPDAPTAASIGLAPAAAPQAAAAPVPMSHAQPPQQHQLAGYGGTAAQPPPLQQQVYDPMPAPQQHQAGLRSLLDQLSPSMLQQQQQPPLQQQQARNGNGGGAPQMLPPQPQQVAQLPPHLQPPPQQQQVQQGMPPPGPGGMPPPPRGPPGPGAPGGMPPPPAGGLPLPGPCGELPPAVQARIARLMDATSGMVRLDHFDPRIVDMMQKMGQDNALRGLDEFSQNDPRSMRSVTAYLIGCLKKYQEDARQQRAAGGGPHGAAPGAPPSTYGPGGGYLPAPPAGGSSPYGASGGGGPGPDRHRDQHRYGAGVGGRYDGPAGGRGGRGAGRGPYDGGRGGRGIGYDGGRGRGGRGPYAGGRGGGGSRGGPSAPQPRGSPTYDAY